MRKPATHILLLLTFLIIVGLASCDSGSADAGNSYERARLTLEQQESLSPRDFISVDGTYRRNLIGEWVLEGHVSSSATVARYQDLVLTVHYYSKTNSLIGSEQHTLYEYLAPGRTVKFEIKSYGYKGAQTVGMEITGAATTI